MADSSPVVGLASSSTQNRSSSESYVYPVKSLLSCRIQPAEDQAEASQLPDDDSEVQWPYDRSLLSQTSSHILCGNISTPHHPFSSIRSSASDRDFYDRERSFSMTRRGELTAPATETVTNALSERTKSSQSTRCYSANYSHYPAGNTLTDPTFRRSFSQQSLVECMTGPTDEYAKCDDDNDPCCRSQSSPGLESEPIPSPEYSTTADAPLNPTEFIYLPPLAIPSNVDKGSIEDPSSPSILQQPLTRRRSSLSSHSSSRSDLESVDGGYTASEAEAHVTFRFGHTEDANGNHVIVGREGMLQKCEDEPICTPGSIQAFGVLIVVQDMEDALVVRQVSENSTELLGLSPRYLFSLDCFTDTFPESQANILWENIPHIDDQKNDDDSSPQVFLISGWGAPGNGFNDTGTRREWTCWCAIHRPTVAPDSSSMSNLVIMEFELERDLVNPLYPPETEGSSIAPSNRTSASGRNDFGPDCQTTQQVVLGNFGDKGLSGDEQWLPSLEDVTESTTMHSKPIPALERLRKTSLINRAPKRRRRQGTTDGANHNVGMMDLLAVLGQINEQLGAVNSLELFLKVVVGIVKDLTQFHRVMVYQFDESWNGQVVAELIDWTQTKDLYKGLHFPASDIPAQARALYATNKVRILYDRMQTTARIVVRDKKDLEVPLNMTHCYLRAMSPIHVQYLANMGVRASMSISILAFNSLWGLITCHSYGTHGMRVSFAVRQILRLLSQSISRNIERLSYAQRLHTRKLVNSMVSGRQTTGYIVSNTDDLLGLFDADSGILVIGGAAKIIGANRHGQETLIMAEYLRLKKFHTIQASQSLSQDFRDITPHGLHYMALLRFSPDTLAGLQIIAGLLLVPLSNQGTDFIAFLRSGQPREVRWAGKPYKENNSEGNTLEPRKSFKIWSEVVAGRSRAWTDEQLETAGVLALVYGKFIEVWRQKESALQTTRLTEILLSNASHEVRTPLNHIINYLEMALDGPLDSEARENLRRSHAASKSLLFTINDLLDLTRLESGQQTSFYEPFNLKISIENATRLYRSEAKRRDLEFRLELEESPTTVIGDATKIQTVVQNLTANALKFTSKGTITVSCTVFVPSEGPPPINHVVVDITVADTGSGIPTTKLEGIFRDLENVGTLEPKATGNTGLGLGLAVVSRIVGQLDGQLRVDSKEGEGSRFSILIPLALSSDQSSSPLSLTSAGSGDSLTRFVHPRLRRSSGSSEDLDSFVEAMVGHTTPPPLFQHKIQGADDSLPFVKAVKVDTFADEVKTMARRSHTRLPLVPTKSFEVVTPEHPYFRILIVEDNDINRLILAKRLTLDHHSVVNTTNGQEGLNAVLSDRNFDVILMDLQMPILNGFEATREIRDLEHAHPLPLLRPAHRLNGRIPIFAVSASLNEKQHDELVQTGMDGWILKPIDFRRLGMIMKGLSDVDQRNLDTYGVGCNWEEGGWLKK